MNVVKSFVEQFAAVIKGDDAAALAAKVWRQADSAIRTQIAVKEGGQISLEDAVSRAEEALSSVIVNNGVEISQPETYVENIVIAQNALTEAQENLESHKETLEFLRKIHSVLKGSDKK